MIRRIGPVLLFAAITLLACWKPIFHSEFTLLTGSDMARAYFPYFDVAAYWLKKGTFLLWDPYVYAGKANMGEPQPGLYYPLNWLFMLVPARDGGMNPYALQTLLILDFFLAGYFFYLLARSFSLSPAAAALSGAAFAYGGYTVQIYGYVNKWSGFVWLPLVLLFFRRGLDADRSRRRYRALVLSGVALALAFLPGHHIPPLHAGLLLLFYAVFRSLASWREASWRGALGGAAALAVVAAVAAAITAVQWLPAAEWARDVYRWIGEGPPLQWGQKVPYSLLGRVGNLAPQNALSLLLPYVSTNSNLYVGPTVLFLALTGALFGRGRDAGFFVAAAAVYFFTSWGKLSALHGWLNTFVPGMWFAREVFHYLVPLQVCLALLAGWGLDRLAEAFGAAPEPRVALWVRRAGWGMALVVLGALGLVAVLHLAKEIPLDHPYLTGLGALAGYLLVLGFLLFLLYTRRLEARVFQFIVAGLAVLDLSSEFGRHIPAKAGAPGAENTFVRAFWKKPPAAEFLIERRKQEAFRVDDPSGVFPPNFGDVWRLEATMGHGATALVDYFALRGTGWGPASNASALLGVRYFPSRERVPGMEKVTDDGPVYRNPRALPRAWVAHAARLFKSDAEMLLWLRSPLFRPRETVLLREQDLTRLAPDFRDRWVVEVDPLRLRILECRTAAEKQGTLLPADSAERHRLEVFQPAWGWSAGDEVVVRIAPEKRVAHCYLTVDFQAEGALPSLLAPELDGPGGSRRFTLELPASGPSRRALDLGPLEPGEYRLKIERTDTCSANVDRIRITTSPPDAGTDAGTVTLASFEPNRLVLEADTTDAAFVVCSEVYYRGWEARIDGRPAPLLRGDHVLRAVPIPPGKHALELRFRPRTFRIGLVISLASIAGAVLALALARDGKGAR